MGSNSIPRIRVGSTSLPVLGFGTAVFPFAASETMKESILHAIKLGYRHFDTAAVYNSEPSLGEAIAEALRLRLITSREGLFITSKLWCSDGHPHLVLPALQTTLQKLGLEYIDLYLIHFPVSLKPGTGYEVPFNKENLVPMDFKCVWEAMEECHRLGLTKNIGVSNFSCKKLDQLLLTSNITPMVNQVCLRWVYEQGVSVLVKSYNKERIKENLEIFDWTLSLEDCHKISQISQQKRYHGLEFVWDKGPYKSALEFWDKKI
ncbi:probable NAD(P)H-dependent oxidoreductase 1 isoform X2 [Cornus florida]|uniref:probable NAD(P)H-dependent oxidoreductase 1 isoform X2 n=1 Tax=Cornus florida TaxID=4283 RepID=UPI00289E7382|nr:probable NAD(P)H-dependent oxidoreductase 1 isoform X2 [Cornus florida]